MPKFSNKGLLAIALILSVMISLLVYNYLQKASGRTDAKDSVPVIVAKADMPPKTKITPGMVEETKVPSEYVQPGAVMDLNSIVGTIVREHIVPGEQVTEQRLMRENKAAGFTGIIPRDKRALTVMVNEVSGVAGFIKPGDYVDVIATFDQSTVGDDVSHLILQNVLVLAANRDAEDGITAEGNKQGAKETIKTSTITLAVTPDEAAKLTLVHEKGKINLALRPYLPLNGIEITNVVTPKDLVGIQVPSTPQPVYITSETANAVPSSGGPGVSVIRGTEIETIPLN
ncbi:MAG: Flp pilus assembly protein CpaB [Negativicutes bacterium]